MKYADMLNAETETVKCLEAKNKPSYVLQPLTAAVVAALNPGAAAAQEGAEEGLSLEEITVTATRREMNIQDVGQSINTITTADIEKLSISNLEDVMRNLPAVSLNSYMPGINSIIFRGISTGVWEYYTDSQVAVYLDEQPITTISQQPDLRMIDIARVESLPGPQGTLFGSSSQSGTIRYITNRPDPTGFSAQIAAEMSATTGGEPSHDLSGWVNIPISNESDNGTLTLRIAAYKTHEGGYIDNVFGTTLEGSQDNSAFVEEDYNEWDNSGARLRALWEINEDWEVNLSYIIQKSSLEGSYESDPSFDDDFQHVKFFKEYRDDDWSQFSLTVKGDLGFADLIANASWFDRTVVYEWDNMVYEQWKDAYYGVYWGIPLYNSDYTFGTIFNDQNMESEAFEIRMQSKGDSKLGWMIGGYYEENLNHWWWGALNEDYVGTTSWYAAQAYAYYYGYYLGYDVAYPLPPTNVGYGEDYTNITNQKAVFGQLSYDFTDKLSANVGMRWFEYERDTRTVQEFPGGIPPFGSFDIMGTVEAAGNDSDTVMQYGIKYNFTDEIMLFGHYASGFRLGGENAKRAADTGFVPYTYKPDEVTNTEIGLKSQFLDGRVLLNVVAFSMEWDQIQINQSSVGGQWWLRGTINGGKGQNKGYEINAEWQVTDRLYLWANGSFGDPKYTEDIVRLNDVVPAGTAMVWAYKEKVSAGIEYTIPDVLGGDMWFSFNHYTEGEKWNNLTNSINKNPLGIVPSSKWSSANVGLMMDNGWDIQLTVNNLFDERGINSLWNDPYSGSFFGDDRFDNWRTYTRPRTTSLTVRKNFD
ncbi:MAG: hypothetical protein CMO98_03020 [Woeseia sp.]|nr:hypothetical protein [Woeseia sp.]